MPSYDGDDRWATPPPTAGGGGSSNRPPSSSRSAVVASAPTADKRKRLRRQFIFDHLWGIPGKRHKEIKRGFRKLIFFLRSLCRGLEQAGSGYLTVR